MTHFSMLDLAIADSPGATSLSPTAIRANSAKQPKVTSGSVVTRTVSRHKEVFSHER